MQKIKLKSTFQFNKAIAKKFCNTKYYTVQDKNSKMQEFIDLEKIRLSTPRWEQISRIFEDYKDLAEQNKSTTGKVLLGIYKKNCSAAINNSQAINSNLLSILSNPETLIIAYRHIRGNKGSLTAADCISKDAYNNLNSEQKEIYLKSISFPDKISLQDFFTIAQLLKKGLYPWGTSSRIFIPKPGVKDKQRPITIPPFMDKIVQKAITLILQAIYEPYFEKMNRSFGFRPNKGTLDAITALISKKTNGMRTALEGDIEAAFDSAKKDKLIEIMRSRIKDEKFLKLIKNRLNYELVIKATGERVTPETGVPQGGVDSPYLWNIYMFELDNFVHTKLSSLIDNINKKYGGKRIFSKLYNSNRATVKKIKRKMNAVKKILKQTPNLDSRKELFELIKKVRLQQHHKNRISSATSNKKLLRIFYIRYADDWIILTNGDSQIAEYLKKQISKFLLNELGLTLSEKKTLITNITKEAAHFLGFEIRCSGRGALYREKVNSKFKKHNLSKKSGLLVWCQPDRQRLINRFHMKGFCDKNGFPLGLPWLSCLEPQVIIERTNSVIRGFANFYLPCIRNKSKIHFWIYILRFSCLKTLAQKYKCSIKKIFKRFGHDLFSKSNQTVRFTVKQDYFDKTYSKEWKLLTYNSLLRGKYKEEFKEMLSNFWDRENGVIGEYPIKIGQIAQITNDNYLEKLTWTSWRTTASLNMPCAYCGTFEKVQMHHIRHIRKRAYSLIPEPDSYQRIMALRNRKQIPLCETHHRVFVHGGKYDGPRLMNLLPREKMLDNRIIHLESFVKPGWEYFGKSLSEKGWAEEKK